MNRKNKAIILILSIILLISGLNGCEMFTNIIESPKVLLRIEAFEAALNSSIRVTTTITANFAPYPETEYRSQIEESDFWDTYFDPDFNYSFEVTDTSDFSAVAATLTKSLDGTDLDPIEVTFKMFQDTDGSWFIEEYREAGIADPVIKTIKP